MAMKAEQEKLKKLLTEAIPLLCKNSVQFKHEFAIEALVGITVDKDKVFLVSINETVPSDFPQYDDTYDDQQCEVPQTSPVHEFSHREGESRRRKRKTPGHRPNSYTAGSPTGESYNSTPVGTPQLSNPATPDYSATPDDESRNKKPRNDMPDPATLTVKKEPGQDSDDDLVFVKQDMSDMDFSQMIDQQSDVVSFPNVSLNSEKAQKQPMPSTPSSYHNTAPPMLDSSGHNPEASTSQQVCPNYGGTFMINTTEEPLEYHEEQKKEFYRLMEDYGKSLSKGKESSFCITQEIYDMAIAALELAKGVKCDNGAKFKFWCSKHFTVHEFGSRKILYCKKTACPVVPKEHIFDTIYRCHARVGHSRRDKTWEEIKSNYAWIRHCLVQLFLNTCTVCASGTQASFKKPLQWQ